MSQENMELAERVVAAVNDRDVDGYLACCADDVKLQTPWSAVEGVYEGAEAIRRFFADLQDWAPHFRLTIERAEPIGDARVLVFLRASLTGRASGLPAAALSGGLSEAPASGDLPTATVYDFAGGKVTGIRVYVDRDQALEAVGLREQARSHDNSEQRRLAEAGIGALNSGDLEAFLALTAEDVEFTSMVAEAEGTTFRGHDGIRAWWETVRGAFEDVRWELLDLHGSGDRAVMHLRMSGTLGSVPVEQTMWQAVVLRDEKLIWWAFFRSEREALEAVGPWGG